MLGSQNNLQRAPLALCEVKPFCAQYARTSHIAIAFVVDYKHHKAQHH